MIDCNIIQDLLPNYLEDMVQEKTKIEIENHLETCSECRLMKEKLEEPIQAPLLVKDSDKIDFLEKFRNREKRHSLINVIALMVLIFITIIVFIKIHANVDNVMITSERETIYMGLVIDYQGNILEPETSFECNMITFKSTNARGLGVRVQETKIQSEGQVREALQIDVYERPFVFLSETGDSTSVSCPLDEVPPIEYVLIKFRNDEILYKSTKDGLEKLAY